MRVEPLPVRLRVPRVPPDQTARNSEPLEPVRNPLGVPGSNPKKWRNSAGFRVMEPVEPLEPLKRNFYAATL